MSEPRLLILETSARRGLVAVAAGERLLGTRVLDEARRNARDLAPAVAALLREQGWAARELSAVIVSRGPGSYTGLRVGVMSAKALAYATACALIGIDTFAVLARQAPPECARVDVIADAQKDNVYVQPFVCNADGWQPVGDLAIRKVADWLAGRHPDAWASGPGLVKWRSHLHPEILCVAEAGWQPGAEGLLALGLARYRAEQRDDPFALEPLYLRPSAAEQQWQGRPSAQA